jgi:hypothetical protein
MRPLPLVIAGAATLAALASTVGCATTYTPRADHRLSFVMSGGKINYYRDGHEYEGGPFGGELDEAVRGVPEAEEHARSYQNLTVAGFVVTLFGAAGIIGGASLAGADYGSNKSFTGTGDTGLALILGGFVLEMVGIAVVASAQPHLFDAINIYNDRVSDAQDRPTPLAPPPVYPLTPAAPPQPSPP